MQQMIRWLRYNLMYLGTPPWETGISPPELLEFLQQHPPGSALDLGCGTGTNLLTMAQHGWHVTGVDFAIRAVWSARRKLANAGLRSQERAQVRRGDVTRFEDVRGKGPNPFYDLVLDIGCYHGLSADGRAAYRRNLPAILARQGHFLLYANWRATDSSPFGILQEDVDALSKILELESRQDSHDRFERMASWMLFRQLQE
jgi:cyclopropane fatty-acyl-phospholipid synthase-like methyltransferase